MQTIFLTEPSTHAGDLERIGWLLHIIAPLLALAILGLVAALLLGTGAMAARNFMLGWLVAAVAGFSAVPNYFDHYALPVAAPLAVACGWLFVIRYAGPAAGVLLSGWLLLASGYPQTARTERSRVAFEEAAETIKAHLGNGCMFAYDAPAALYRETKSCLPTSRVFSEHLSNAREAKAIGVDPVTETIAILKSVPTVIALPTRPTLRTPNRNTRSLVEKALQKNYVHISTHNLESVVDRTAVEIWVVKKAKLEKN